MDLTSFLPINSTAKVDLLIDAIQSERRFKNLNALEKIIILNIRSLKTQLYFKERFKALKGNNLMRRGRRKRMKTGVLVIKSPKISKESLPTLRKFKKKNPPKRLITSKTYELYYTKETLRTLFHVPASPSKFKGVRRKRAKGNHNYYKIIYAGHPKS